MRPLLLAVIIVGSVIPVAAREPSECELRLAKRIEGTEWHQLTSTVTQTGCLVVSIHMVKHSRMKQDTFMRWTRWDYDPPEIRSSDHELVQEELDCRRLRHRQLALFVYSGLELSSPAIREESTTWISAPPDSVGETADTESCRLLLEHYKKNGDK